MKNLNPETAYAISAVVTLVSFALGWLTGRRGRKAKQK